MEEIIDQRICVKFCFKKIKLSPSAVAQQIFLISMLYRKQYQMENNRDLILFSSEPKTYFEQRLLIAPKNVSQMVIPKVKYLEKNAFENWIKRCPMSQINYCILNGDYFYDRTLLIWSATNIGDTQTRKSFRINVEYDCAAKVCWSPDSKAIIIQKAIGNCIEVYKIDKKDGFFTNPVKALTFSQPSTNQENDIIGFGISCTGRFIMTCSNGTDLIIWDLKGNIIQKLDTYLMSNYSAKISTCGRFVAACGFSPDAKVWEIKFNRTTGEYIKTINAFNLTGHNSGIYDIAFDQDTSHMATVSKDGTWKLYNTKIEYEQGQLPRCLLTGKYTQKGVPSKIALSLNGEVIVIASAMDIEIFSGKTGLCDATITKIFSGYINALFFDPFGKYILTVGDKYIRVFHNVTGYRVDSINATEKLRKNQTAATRERLEKLIEDNEKFLKNF